MTKIISLRIVIFIAISFYPYFLKAQSGTDFEDIGHFYDIDGNYIDGFLEMDYKPLTVIKIDKSKKVNYRYGCYIDLNGDTIKRKIYGDNFNDSFKFSDGATTTTIKANNCKKLIIYKDTFEVIHNVKIFKTPNWKIEEGDLFVKRIAKIKNVNVFQNHHSGKMHYYLNLDNSEDYFKIPEEDPEFLAVCNPIFNHLNSLKLKIGIQEYNYQNFLLVIRLFDFKNKLLNHEKIFFDQSWNELPDKTNSDYYGLVTDLQDSIWTIEYYNKNDVKIHKGEYSSIYPFVKSGNFEWFYHNGNTRKISYYIKDKLKGETKIFHPNGTLKYKLDNKKNRLTYSQVYDKDGKSLLDDKGNGEEIFVDSALDREIIREYAAHRLVSAYIKKDSSENIYQLADRNAKPKTIESVQNIIREDKSLYPIEAFTQNIQGYMLLKLIIDQKGKLKFIKLIKGIDKECDTLIINKLKTCDPLKSWKPGKHGGKSVSQEIILPVRFQTEKYPYNDFMKAMAITSAILRGMSY